MLNERKNKICVMHLITSLNIGGAELMLCRLVQKMDHDKFENIIVTMITPETGLENLVHNNIQVFSLGMSRSIPNPIAIFKFIKLLRIYKPDILQTWLYHADLLGLIAGKLVKINRIIWNIRCSDVDMSKYSFLSKLSLRILSVLSHFPDAIISNTNNGIYYHEKIGYKPKLWKYIPNGIDIDRFKPHFLDRESFVKRYNLPVDAVLVGNVARYDPMKGQEIFLQAASCLIKEYSNVYFVLAGKDINNMNQKLVEMISEYKLEKKVLLLGQRKDIKPIIAALDIFTSSSLFGEGFPNVIAEAMACGVICVATNVGDSKTIINDKKYIVPPGDSNAILNTWHYILALENSEIEYIKSKNIERILSEFSIKKIVKEYEEFYQMYKSVKQIRVC